MILWAMSMWASAIVLAASDFGAEAFRRYGLSKWSVVVLGGTVWILGWWAIIAGSGMYRVDLGFVLLSGFAWIVVAVFGDGRWWLLAPLLGVVGTMVRAVAPFSFHQAQVLPTGPIEALSLGVAGGLSLPDPLAASAVAGAAEGMACVLTAFGHAHGHNLGRHDLAACIMAVVAAWLIAWVAALVHRKMIRRLA